jgi:transglutaminase-like putative cysteine protease
VGPAVVKQIHERIVQIARDHRVAEGRRMRLDTTVVETNIHYPTDSSLLGDGVRVLTRKMKKITGIAGAHLAVALCRCMAIPARYCTDYLGYIGVPATDAPMVSQPGSKPISVASGTPWTRATTSGASAGC